MTKEEKYDLKIIGTLFLIMILVGTYLYFDNIENNKKEINIYEYNNLLNIKKIINNEEFSVINTNDLQVYETKDKIELSYRDIETMNNREKTVKKMMSFDPNNKNLKEIKSLIDKDKISNEEYKNIVSKIYDLNNDMNKIKEEKNNNKIEEIKKELRK